MLGLVTIISASLAIRIAEQSANVIDHVVPRLSTKQAQHLHCDRSNNSALYGSHMHDLDYTVNMLGLCDPSNLLFVLSAEERRALIKLL